MPNHSTCINSMIYTVFIKQIINMFGGVNTQPSADIHHVAGSVGSAEAGCLCGAGREDTHGKDEPIRLSWVMRDSAI